MNEISLLFGPERNLVGTLTRPGLADSSAGAAASISAEPVACLLFNAGVIHRIGPHRINVKLARRLAQLGFTSLRFDLSGQGDSRNASSALSYREQAVADVRAAIDHLERSTDIHHFVLGGICSGADHSWAAALADPRVVGLWLLDGYVYPSTKTPWVRWVKRLHGGPILRAIVPSLWRRTQAALARLRAAHSKNKPTAITDYGRQTPPREDYARDMQTLVDRGVKVQLIYSGSQLTHYNYAQQFADVFGAHRFATQVRCDYRPDIDHTATPLAAQAALVELVAGFAQTVQSSTAAKAL